MTELYLKEYKVQTTGAGGGHNYIIAELIYKGVKRRLVILFANKSEEISLDESKPIKVKGKIEDSGIEYDLLISNAEIIA